MADDALTTESFVGMEAGDVAACWTRARTVVTMQSALSELKEAEGRLIYAKHLLEQEYSRVFAAVKLVRTVVGASVVLTPEAYDQLLAEVRHERCRAAAVAGGAGAGATDAAHYARARRPAHSSGGGGRGRGSGSSVSCEDSE